MTAASTGVFDSERWCWDAELLAGSGVGPGQLPEVRAATTSAPLRADAAAELGLPGGLPVVLGGMDGPLAQLGAAGLSDDIATCTAGTSIACPGQGRGPHSGPGPAVVVLPHHPGPMGDRRSREQRRETSWTGWPG